jgi:RNA polymerase sigma-70 factor (ECF subfamily)
MEAFAMLFEPFRHQALTVAARIVGADEAQDVVMDAYLKAWRALPAFNGHCRLSTWLFRIVWNCATDHVRLVKRRRESALPENEKGASVEPADPSAPPPDRQVIQQETESRLDKALEQLPDSLRITLLLRYADGFSYREIADAMGVRIGTVMSRLFHGRQRLKRLLNDEREEFHS